MIDALKLAYTSFVEHPQSIVQARIVCNRASLLQTTALVLKEANEHPTTGVVWIVKSRRLQIRVDHAAHSTHFPVVARAVDGEAAVTVRTPPDRLPAILRRQPDEYVDIAVHADRVILTFLNATYALIAVPPTAADWRGRPEALLRDSAMWSTVIVAKGGMTMSYPGSTYELCTWPTVPDTKAAKRTRVEALLHANRTTSNELLARAARVSAAFVGKVRKSSLNEMGGTRTVCRKGKWYTIDVRNIGKRSREADLVR